MDILKQRQELNKLGISLHSRIVGLLVDQIEDAISMGYIRVEYLDGKEWFSVYDFIRVILNLKSEWVVWKRFIEGDSDIPTFCTLISFAQESGRKSRESPATNFTGLLYVAYLANCDFSKQLRKASAAHFASDHQIPIVELDPIATVKKFDVSQLPATPLAPFPHTLTKLHQISGIVSRSQVRRAVTRDYQLGTEYIKIGRELFLTEDTFNWLVTHFESERGTDIEQLPETIPLKRKGFKRKADHKNARISSEWEQLNIPFPN
jgi:hypothetical protein